MYEYHMHDGLKCIIAKSSWCGSQPGHHGTTSKRIISPQATSSTKRGSWCRRRIFQWFEDTGSMITGRWA